MLSIGKLAAGQEAYYLGKVAEGVEDYYVGGGEAPGRWVGAGAKALGLSGQVDPEELRAMLGGQNPATKEALRIDRKLQSPGFDMTFSAPKSVSILWAFGDDTTKAKVVEAHEQALESVMSFMEQNASYVRRGAGGMVYLKAPRMLAAAYRHRTSRAGDPQLHTHVLVSKLVQADDGRWSSFHGPSLHAHLKTGSYLYRAELRERLTRELGVEWGEVVNGAAAIKGIEPATEAEFSRRRAEILADQEIRGTGSARSFEASTLQTRQKKDYGVEPRELEADWDRRAADVGLTREHVAGLIKGGQRIEVDLPADKALAAHLTNDLSHFARNDVIRAICEAADQGISAASAERAADRFLERDMAVEITAKPWGKTYSTPEIIRMEEEILTTTRLGLGERRCVASPTRIEAVLAARGLDLAAEASETDPQMKKVIAQQRQMVEAVTSGCGVVAGVNGVAGAGKTYALAAANEIWRKEGIQVLGACTSWQASDVLSAQSGIPTKSIAARLYELDKWRDHGEQALATGSVLVVDEAGMVNTKDMYRLLEHVREADGMMLAIGDYDQLQAVGAGGAFRAVYERYPTASMPHSIRQERPVDRKVIELIASGHGAAALDVLRLDNGVVMASSGQQRDIALVGDWWQPFSQGKDALMIAETNRSVGELNALARGLLKDAGELGEGVVTGPDGSEFSIGDQVVTRANDHQAGIRNLQSWQVVGIHEDGGSMRLRAAGDEHEVWIGPNYINQDLPKGRCALQHGYAVTGHVAQGSSHDEVFAQAGINRQWIRTALSRARQSMTLYGVDGHDSRTAEFAPAEAKTGQADLDRWVSSDAAETAAADEPMKVEVAGLSDRELVDRLARIEHFDKQVAAERVQALALLKKVERTSRYVVERKEALKACDPYLLDHERAALERAVAEHQNAVHEQATYLPPTSPETVGEAKAERAMIERELSNKRQRVVAANRIKAPDYIEAAIGDMPQSPHGQAVWIQSVDEIERYRQRWGISDPERPLGQRPKHKDRLFDHTELSRKLTSDKAEIQDIERAHVRGGRETAAVEISGPETPGIEISM